MVIFQLFGNVDFTGMVRWFESIGGYDVVLPFLLIFTIVFAVLEKTKVLGVNKEGDSKKNFNAIVALVIGLLVVAETDIIIIINTFLPKISLAILVGLMFLLLVGLTGGNEPDKGWTGFAYGLAFIISILVVIWALLPEDYRIFSGLEVTPQDRAILLTVGILLAVVFFVTKEEGKSGNMLQGVEDFFKHFGRGR